MLAIRMLRLLAYSHSRKKRLSGGDLAISQRGEKLIRSVGLMTEQYDLQQNFLETALHRQSLITARVNAGLTGFVNEQARIT